MGVRKLTIMLGRMDLLIHILANIDYVMKKKVINEDDDTFKMI